MAFRNIPPNGFPAIPDIEDLESVVKDVNTLKTTAAALTEDVGDLDSNKASKVDIATEFSNLTNYNAGDLVYYEGDLYEFQVDHAAGDWETSEAIQKDLSDIVTTLKSGLTNAQVNFTNELTGTDAIQTTHTVNSAYLTKNGMVIVCTAKLTLTSDITAWSNFAKLNLVTFPDGFQFWCVVGGVAVPAFVTQGGNIQLTQGATTGTEITITFAAVSA